MGRFLTICLGFLCIACGTVSESTSGPTNPTIELAEPRLSTSELSESIGSPEEPSALESRYRTLGLTDVQSVDAGILVDLKYAGEQNFLSRDLYGGLKKCFLQTEIAEMLAKANQSLQADHPGLRLLVFDCARPQSVQKAMWEFAKETDARQYVAPPYPGSMHNHAAAVDVGLADSAGNPLDMGTPYDFFGLMAQPRYEDYFLENGSLKQDQVDNRRLLRTYMREAGFRMIMSEWWHFNAYSKPFVRSNFPIIE
jgi:D-alanyl-D-alanine dipeptidase